MQFSVVVAAAPVGQGRAPRAGAVAIPVVPLDDTAQPAAPLADELAAEVAQFLRDAGHRGAAGVVHVLPRPTRNPELLLLVGVGDGGARAWRDAGAALLRGAADRASGLTITLAGEERPWAGPTSTAAAELALGAWLAAYRFQAGGARRRPQRGGPVAKLRTITLLVPEAEVAQTEAAVARSRTLAEAVLFARDLTNTPSAQKSPKWFADRVADAAARRPGLSLTVLDEAALAEAGFGGVLAVGAGSPRPPRLVQLSWRPRGARTHVVLVGKGICFDTGGISIKPLEGMKLMRKDMGGAAAVCATVLAVADLGLPVRVTALAPLAENLVSGSAMRPGDVIRLYGGRTTEILDTDAEGRLVLGDALAYAAKRLKPDHLIDLATLTGASHVALGKQLGALFSDNAELAEALRAAGDDAGEPVWQLPLTDDYVGLLRSDVADLANIGQPAQAGAVTAALFLRELAGDRRDRWAHIDMSAPSWSDRDNGPLVRGATGWGVRLLVNFLGSL